MARDNYLDIFQSEALEQLDAICEGLIELEKHHDNPEVLNKIFRYTHTLKGAASLDGLEKICELSHSMETIFESLRVYSDGLTQSIINLSFDVVDVLKSLVNSVGSNEYKKININRIAKKIDTITAKTKTKENGKNNVSGKLKKVVSREELSSIISLMEQKKKTHRVNLKFSANDKLSSVMSFIIYNNLFANASFIKPFPSIEQLTNPKLTFIEVEIILVSKSSLADIKNIVSANCHIFQVERLSMEKVANLYSEEKRILQKKIINKTKALPYEIGEILHREISEKKNVFLININIAKDDEMRTINSFIILNNLKEKSHYLYSEPAATNLQKKNYQFDKLQIFISGNFSQKAISEIIRANCKEFDIKKLNYKQINKLFKLKKKEMPRKQTISPTIEVDTIIVDGVIENIGEVILNYNVALQMMDEAIDEINEIQCNDAIKTKFREAYEQALSTSLYVNALMDYAVMLRMAPIKRLFQKFHRIVRDAAHEAKKKINLFIQGERTRLGQEILESLEVILLHLIRNAIDHGIESPKEREKLGKSPEGNITLKAYQVHNRVYIDIKDDGKGLNKKAICDKAIKIGVIQKLDCKKMTDDKIYELIFQPGFTTSKKITQLSGRGIGMDVVLTNIKDIRGEIKISSKENEGTIFTLILPMSI